MDEGTARDIGQLLRAAEAEGRVGTARKIEQVDARPATVGEVVVTRIEGEGEETRSAPAAAGDMIVRNRTATPPGEQYLVSRSVFAQRYAEPLGPADAGGWRAYRPRGTTLRFFRVREADGAFTFTAPWGERMVAEPGDAIVSDPSDPADTYRVAASRFASTYEVLEEPPSG